MLVLDLTHLFELGASDRVLCTESMAEVKFKTFDCRSDFGRAESQGRTDYPLDFPTKVTNVCIAMEQPILTECSAIGYCVITTFVSEDRDQSYLNILCLTHWPLDVPSGIILVEWIGAIVGIPSIVNNASNESARPQRLWLLA